MLDLGYKLLGVLEVIHGAGFVHNDISIDKLAVGTGQRIRLQNEVQTNDNLFDQVSINICDFSYISPYLCPQTKKHLKREKVSGLINISNELQSLNRLKSVRTSRRDDLEMLCNLLIFLSNQYSLPDIEPPRDCKNPDQMMIYL